MNETLSIIFGAAVVVLAIWKIIDFIEIAFRKSFPKYFKGGSIPSEGSKQAAGFSPKDYQFMERTAYIKPKTAQTTYAFQLMDIALKIYIKLLDRQTMPDEEKPIVAIRRAVHLITEANKHFDKMDEENSLRASELNDDLIDNASHLKGH